MDPIAIAFYAVICGCLGAASPVMPSLPARLGVGVVVGVLAAIALPMLKGWLTAYP
ncbi:hypothetical protein AIOL_000339 [Candidatus Rhodobacter oscarellae]|uniref:XapX domain-containing protein n=1 Tax=Candidatus Rhodobacter oscarellae TaxID=1675527 RepID=A0A0J9EC35_9RHOB|nr:hypothetical protein [Candidatus Rhodobacter lobularis]KMW60186.1 hypothetical protein AIOL_000339 [Candidatus Rhodobacter lobularis]